MESGVKPKLLFFLEKLKKRMLRPKWMERFFETPHSKKSKR